jgi:hypothetical protein
MLAPAGPMADLRDRLRRWKDGDVAADERAHLDEQTREMLRALGYGR